LVANKTDLKQRRVISMKQGKELAESHGLEYFETSAVSIQMFFIEIFMQPLFIKYLLV
jgi:hypothetical protein